MAVKVKKSLLDFFQCFLKWIAIRFECVLIWPAQRRTNHKLMMMKESERIMSIVLWCMCERIKPFKMLVEFVVRGDIFLYEVNECGNAVNQMRTFKHYNNLGCAENTFGQLVHICCNNFHQLHREKCTHMIKPLYTNR